MAQAKRRLTDMYRVQSDPIVFDDGDGDPITVIVRKLNPVDHEGALRNANAARSRTATLKNNPEDEEYQSQWSQVLEYDRDDLTRFLLEERRMNRSPILEAELAAEDEWSKEGYLEGLQNSWMEGGLKERYAENPEDVEAKRVLDELERFASKLDEIVQAEVDNFEDDLDRKDVEDLRKMVFDRLMVSAASLAWLHEYRRSEVFYSTRTEDGKERYFKHRDEVSELPPEIFNRLSEVYQQVAVSVVEGKGLQATETSSLSSDQPESPEPEPDSGPEDAAT